MPGGITAIIGHRRKKKVIWQNVRKSFLSKSTSDGIVTELQRKEQAIFRCWPKPLLVQTRRRQWQS